MQITFSTASLYHFPLRVSLWLARELGFAGVELVIGPDYLLRGVDWLQHELQEAEVPALSLHPPARSLPGWPRCEHLGRLRTFQVARELGCRLGVVHIGGGSSLESVPGQAFSASVQACRALAGEQVGVGIETSSFVYHPARYALDSLPTLARFVAATDTAITLDTTHVGANGQDLLASYHLLKDRLKNIHLSDYSGGHTHLLPGRGCLPLAEFLQQLKADNYQGLLTLEPAPWHLHMWKLKQIRAGLGQCLEYVQRYGC